MRAGDGIHGPDAEPVAAVNDVTRRLERARGLIPLPPCVDHVGLAGKGLYEVLELRGSFFDGPFSLRLFAVVKGGLERDFCPRGFPIVMDDATGTKRGRGLCVTVNEVQSVVGGYGETQ